MGAFVFFNIHRANLDFLEGDVLLLQHQQHIGFVLEAVSFNTQHCGQIFAGNGPQAGLRIGDGHADEKFEDAAGGLVAEAAAKRNVRMIKIPDTQGDLAAFCHGFRTGKNIQLVMLSVTVHCDNTHTLRAMEQKIIDGGLQRGTLAPVHRMVQQRNFRMGGSSIGEIMKIFRLAAVVDQQDIPETYLQKPVDDFRKLIIRIQRGQDDADTIQIGHNSLLSKKAVAQPSAHHQCGRGKARCY